MEATAPTTIFTIGHSNHPWDLFADQLRASEISALIDVRSIPRSRFAHFNHAPLTVRLAALDIGLDPERYSGHGLRAGYATSAALSAHDALMISKQTEHRTMQALNAYVRPVTPTDLQLALTLPLCYPTQTRAASESYAVT